MIITIDGPAGAGKSSVARIVARKLGYHLLDTGAMYRSVAYRALQEGIPDTEAARLVEIAESMRFSMDEQASNVMRVDGVVAGDEIRTAEVSDYTSRLSVHPELRTALVQKQRELIANGGFVLEGRDTGTVVCPAAELKIFMTASLDARARRRRGDFPPSMSLGEIRASIHERDVRDESRATSPTKPADDAITVDTSELTLEEVVAQVVRLSRERARAFVQ